MGQKEHQYYARVVAFFIVSVICTDSALAFKCYTCDDIQTSEDCMNVTDCRPDEMCFVRSDGYPTGEVRHTLGCTGNDADIADGHTFCSEICHDDYCNLNGCGLPVSPLGKTERSPRCLSCNLISRPDACKNLVQCKDNQVCFSRAVTIYGKLLYRMGCIDKQHCSDQPVQPVPTIVGKRAPSDLSCSVCCTTDFCNVQDCHVQRQNGTAHELYLLGDNTTCFDSNPGACSAFGLLSKDACSTLPSVDTMCPDTCGICGHYGWESWNSWTACSQTCGDGVSQRTRNCLHQIAVADQFNCTGITTDTRPCRMRACDVEGTWSSWEAWDACSISCGRGTKRRQRYCKNTSLQHGNLYCTGDTIEESVCNGCECDGWIAYEGSCYYFGPVATDFNSALSVCLTNGSTLVHIDSQRENTFISDHIKGLAQSGPDDWWIGITDKQHEGTWILTGTNTRVLYTNWAPGEPSNSGENREEDCAVIADRYTWNDVNCDHTHNRPVCEKLQSATLEEN